VLLRFNKMGSAFEEMRLTIPRYLLLCMAAALLTPLAQAQGVLEGRLLNGTNPAITPVHVPVDAIGLGSGMSVLKSSVTDAAGKFHMDGLPARTPLLIRATYGGVSYYSQASFDASGKARVDILVYEATASTQGIRLENVRIAFKLTADGLNSLESYTFNNETKPPRSFMRKDGNFRFSKPPGITELPSLDVTAPGASMPVSQPPLESADGESYYSLYPVRPGVTTFDVSLALPYRNGGYTYRKKFYHDVRSLNIGVIPADVMVSGVGLKKVETDAAQNFAVYSTGPIKAGTEAVWTFSGGTPVASAPARAEEPRIQLMPTLVEQNALVIGPLLLAGLILVLWFAHSHVIPASGIDKDTHLRELSERREQLLSYVAALDARYESQGLERRQYLRLREQGKRHLRRIAALLAKTGARGQESQARSREPEAGRKRD